MLSVETLPVPSLQTRNASGSTALGWTADGIVHVTARYGYMETRTSPTSSGRSES